MPITANIQHLYFWKRFVPALLQNSYFEGYDKYKKTSLCKGPPQHGASSGCGWRNGLQQWRVAANILNKQPQTNERGGLPAWG
jgi:hypothetical protein